MAVKKFTDSSQLFNYFHSHKIPLSSASNNRYRYHGANNESIESMTAASVSAFHQSAVSSPVIIYERPGFIYLDDELHEVCAAFRAKKSSVDPSAYTKQEKFEFLDKIIDLGVFTDFGSVSSSSVKGSNKKRQEIKEDLIMRGVISASIMSSHFCRDSLRIIANVFDSYQISWLLEHANDSIVFNPELLDQLEDFSMFSSSHVVSAFTEGHYDWFKNPKALKTLKPEVLIGLFAEMKYDLSFEQLDLLNSARPIEKLFETKEFFDNPFVWQITAGTPYFDDDHININALADLIQSSDNELMSEDLKRNLIGLYIHSEIGIISHSEALLQLKNSEADSADINGETKEVDNESVNIETVTETLTTSTTVLPPLSAEDVQISLAEYHFKALKYIFTHRQVILVSLMTRQMAYDDDEGLQNLIGLFVTPATYASRSAMKLVEQVEEELGVYGNVEIRDFLKILNDPSTFNVFSKRIALIFAFCQLKFGIIKLPYRDVEELEIMSTDDMIRRFKLISLPKDFFITTKWPRIFFIQQVIDYKLSQPFQMEKDNIDVDITVNAVNDDAHAHAHDDVIKKILEGYLIFLDLKGFNDFDIGILKYHFSENNLNNLIKAVETEKSLKVKFSYFKTEFLILSERYNDSIQNIADDENFLHSTVSISAIECRLMSLIQNCFNSEMSNLLLEDSEFLHEFSNFSHFLKRSQVAELLKLEDGRRLLSEARQFLHNLPTFEDFKASDVKPLKLQAQYATMVRTLPLIPLLISFKYDEFIFNDPLALSWRLFGTVQQQTNGELMNSSWKIIPFQMLAELWKTGDRRSDYLCLYKSGIQSYLRNSREVNGKPLEALKSILHWVILQEIKFLEAFLLINSRESRKFQDALNAAIYLNNFEHVDRDFILDGWINSIACDPEVQSKLHPKFIYKLLEVIGGPLSQVRGGAFLVARNIMDKNFRMIEFSEYFSGFRPWISKMFDEVKLKPKEVDVTRLPVQSETYTVTSDKIIRDSDKEFVNLEKNKKIEDHEQEKKQDGKVRKTSTATANTPAAKPGFQFVFNPNKGGNSHTNIPQYREHLEQDIITRQNILLKLLSELETVTNNSTHSQLWIDRVKLLGMFSADGFTLSPNFDLEETFDHLPLHELILYKKLRKLSGVDEESFEEGMAPETLATTIIQFGAITAEVGKKEETVSKKKKNRK